MTDELRKIVTEIAKQSSYDYYFNEDDVLSIVSQYCENSDSVKTFDDVMNMNLINDDMYYDEISNLLDIIYDKKPFSSEDEEAVKDIIYDNFTISADPNPIYSYDVKCNIIIDPIDSENSSDTFTSAFEFITDYVVSQLGISNPYNYAIKLLAQIHDQLANPDNYVSSIFDECKESGYFEKMPSSIQSYFNELQDMVEHGINYGNDSVNQKFAVTVSMQFGDYLKLRNEILQDDILENIIIPQYCAFGYFDPLFGDAGALNVNLKRPFKIKNKFISDIFLDTSQMQITDEYCNTFSYTVDAVCGMSGSCYRYLELEDKNGRNI